MLSREIKIRLYTRGGEPLLGQGPKFEIKIFGKRSSGK